jgi:hypothetical protein
MEALSYKKRGPKKQPKNPLASKVARLVKETILISSSMTNKRMAFAFQSVNNKFIQIQNY